MTLDLTSVAPQVYRMAAELEQSRDERHARLERARGFLARMAPHWAALGEKARRSGRSSVAPLGPLDAHHPPPPSLPGYEVLATDGSTIEPDRHGPATCALINIGRVRIRYGTDPAAQLDSLPTLYSREDELHIQQESGRRLLSEQLLTALRSVAEMDALGRLARETEPSPVPRVALADGLLTIWRQDWAAADADVVTERFGAALDAIMTLGLPLGAYVSRPKSHWVVDLLREAGTCRSGTGQCALECGSDPCALDGLFDVQLHEFLGPGERSGVFQMVGRDAERYGDHNRSHFFYLNVDRETARVEIPRWVAADDAALRLIHGVVWDQAERGRGYPVCLARAHEQAVITGVDRRAFQQLVAESLVRAGLPVSMSEKQLSKNVHAV